MAVAAAGILAAAEPLNHDLRSLRESNHFGRDARTRQMWLAELELRAIAEGDDLLQLQLSPLRQIAIIEGHFLALFHFILSSAVGDDRVHGSCFGMEMAVI